MDVLCDTTIANNAIAGEMNNDDIWAYAAAVDLHYKDILHNLLDSPPHAQSYSHTVLIKSSTIYWKQSFHCVIYFLPLLSHLVGILSQWIETKIQQTQISQEKN